MLANIKPRFDWNESALTTLRVMLSNGKTGSQIAKALGNGVTRNAVIGKIHRLKWAAPKPIAKQRRGQNIKAAMAHRRSINTTATMPRKPKVLQPVIDDQPPANPISILALTDGACRWPYIVAGRVMFGCACSRVPGLPYCEHHAAVAYYRPDTDKPARVRSHRARVFA